MFFFFKQKTAYEMRISDWSSDVCSSDLGTAGQGGEGIRAKSAMTLRNCRFLDLGNGCVRVHVPTNNLVIEDCEAEHIYRFLEDTSSSNANPAVLYNFALRRTTRSEEHTSERQSLIRISSAFFCSQKQHKN